MGGPLVDLRGSKGRVSAYGVYVWLAFRALSSGIETLRQILPRSNTSKHQVAALLGIQALFFVLEKVGCNL